MKYERPIMNISMFELEGIATGDPTITMVSNPNVTDAIHEGNTRLSNSPNAQKALYVIRFNNGNDNQ